MSGGGGAGVRAGSGKSMVFPVPYGGEDVRFVFVLLSFGRVLMAGEKEKQEKEDEKKTRERKRRGLSAGKLEGEDTDTRSSRSGYWSRRDRRRVSRPGNRTQRGRLGEWKS